MRIQTLSPYLAGRARPKGVEPELLVIHNTAGSSTSGAVSTLRKVRYSYHYLIPDEDEGDGATVWKCCPTSLTAFHAGNSYGPREFKRGTSIKQSGGFFTAGCSVNDYSIGISLVNRNDGQDPYGPGQIKATFELCKLLCGAYPIKAVSSHYAVSPGRKSDPRGFPMIDLAAFLNVDYFNPFLK